MRAGLAAIAMASLLPGAALACIAPAHQLTQMPETAVLDPDTTGPVTGAWFDSPTTRYTHGVLGDQIEAGALFAYSDRSHNSCNMIWITLDQGHVFEDVAPRLVDLDGDGENEIIVVRSSATQGAQLAVYGDSQDGESLRLIAATPYIGRANRWLAPIGASDLDGDGVMEIAYIDRPHLAKTLRVWRYESETLTEVAAAGGLTNHRIGEDFISSGIRDCGDGSEMITANANWSRLIATRFDGETITARDLGAWSQSNLTRAMGCNL